MRYNLGHYINAACQYARNLLGSDSFRGGLETTTTVPVLEKK